MSLVTQKLTNSQEKVVSIPTHRIIAVDCSGSMSGELPKLRKQLKNKLTSMILPDDSLSIIWFSGRDQCGVLFEDVSVSTATDLTKVHAAIDRFLVPVGLTSFKEPLEKTLEVIMNSSDKPVSLSFMTDGGNNDSSRQSVMTACAKVGELATSVSFIEYGYYADHNMLVAMAEESGGSVVQAENFDDYTDTLDKLLKGKSAGKRKTLENILADFVVGITADSVIVAKPVNGTVSLPSSTSDVVYFDENSTHVDVAPQVAAAMVAALVNKGDLNKAIDVAAQIGDEPLFNALSNAFSKQDYARAAALATEYAVGTRELHKDGVNHNLTIDPSAYTVLALLLDLSEQEGNFLHISHPDFSYQAIGAKSEPVPDENGFVPKFTDTATNVMGAISSLSFNEDRPNISILVKREGTVSLPENEYGFGESFNSFIFRNYAVVRDGIVNLKKLPVVLCKASHDLLTHNGVISEPFKVNQTVVIDLTKMPVINRDMAKPITAREMFTKVFELYKLRVEAKVLGNKYEKGETSEKFEALYGEEGALFLKKYGITPGGFSVKSIKVVSDDKWVAKVLEVKLSSLSSIPKISEVQENILKGKKLTPSAELVAAALAKYKDLSEDDYVTKHRELVLATREARREIVMMKFGVILGRTWFSDMPTLDDNTLDMDFGLSKPITAQAILSDKEV